MLFIVLSTHLFMHILLWVGNIPHWNRAINHCLFWFDNCQILFFAKKHKNIWLIFFWKSEEFLTVCHSYKNIISFCSNQSTVALNCKINRNHKFLREIESEIVALPCSVHCFLPDLPDNGTMPAMAPKIERIVIKIFSLCVSIIVQMNYPISKTSFPMYIQDFLTKRLLKN